MSSDEWCTPDWLFQELNNEFNFSIDLCATAENSKCELYCIDYLNNVCHIPSHYNEDLNEIFEYGKAVCFMNPPYSNPKPFMEKAWDDSRFCRIVCLLPSTIKTCKYLDTLDENKGLTTFRKWKQGVEIRDLSRRTQFNHPIKESSSPSFGCMLVIMDRRQT